MLVDEFGMKDRASHGAIDPGYTLSIFATRERLRLVDTLSRADFVVALAAPDKQTQKAEQTNVISCPGIASRHAQDLLHRNSLAQGRREPRGIVRLGGLACGSETPRARNLCPNV